MKGNRKRAFHRIRETLNFLLLFTASMLPYAYTYVAFYLKRIDMRGIVAIGLMSALLLGILIDNIRALLIFMFLGQLTSLLTGMLLVAYPVMIIHTDLSQAVMIDFIRKSLALMLTVEMPLVLLFMFIGFILSEYLGIT
ncbi:MAG: hypothetical protein J7L11_03915 [Thermoprotei archaeon]|nr:hypothetical protein [Thermoprotei archaeon]